MLLKTKTKVSLAKGLSEVIARGRGLVGLDSHTEVVRGGLRWQLDLSEGIDLAIYLFGVFERETLSAIRRRLNPGCVVFDIGANVGALTLQMARLVGPAGRVVAFEPTQYAFHKLQRNVELNGDLKERVILEQVMLGESMHAVVPKHIYSSWPLTDDVHLHGKHGGRLMPTVGARATSVDEYRRQSRVRHVDLVKIDVDGSECTVLRGARATLRECRPVIVMEFAPYVLEEAGSTVGELCEILSEVSYQLYDIGTGKALPLRARDMKAMVPDGCGINVIAAPNSAEAAITLPLSA